MAFDFSTELSISLDLGSDTLKIAFAYKQSGMVRYGKLIKDGLVTHVAMPAIAYYDEHAKKWIYGDCVEAGEEKSFVNVVKIKNLLSLVEQVNPSFFTFKNIAEQKAAAAAVFEKNVAYYGKGHEFPKFFFPLRRKFSRDFASMVKNDLTFRAPDYTPRDVCRGFFEYIAAVVEVQVGKLSKERGLKFSSKKISLVYPAKAGKLYVSEYTSLVEKAFELKVHKSLNSTKALSMYAYHRGMLGEGESLLAFDMGEEDISVAKAVLLPPEGPFDDAKLVVEGADGHSAPCDIGGNDIDSAIAKYIEQCIYNRETVGTPSHGNEGHIYESGLESKQYLFMKDIKKAKMILSMPDYGDGVFASGAPVSLCRDLYIQRKITKDEFRRCAGIADDNGVARQIVDYIEEELSLAVNRDVTKVFLSGGLVETLDLVDYIKKSVKKNHVNISFYTFDDNVMDGDDFAVLTYEDSTYAPAIGGAIVSAMDYDVRTAIALSYATWMGLNLNDAANTRVLFLDIFVDRGTILPKGNSIFTTGGVVRGSAASPISQIKGEEIYSATVTRADISAQRNKAQLKDFYLTTKKDNYLLIGKSGSKERKRLAKIIGMKTVSGGENAKIVFMHGDRRVQILGDFDFVEGVIIDPDGRANPYIASAAAQVDAKDTQVYIKYLVPAGKDSFTPVGNVTKVPAREIRPVFEGLSVFDAETDN